MRNPFRTLREDFKLGSPEVASQKLEVSSQLLRFAEDGLYTEPPAKLTSSLQKNNLLSSEELTKFRDDYYAFQLSQRRQNFGSLDPNLDLSKALSPLVHPMKFWRISSPSCLTSHACCRKFCFAVNTYNEWERGRYLSVPISITNALLDSGYSLLKLDELKEVYAAYVQLTNAAVGVEFNVR